MVDVIMVLGVFNQWVFSLTDLCHRTLESCNHASSRIPGIIVFVVVGPAAYIIAWRAAKKYASFEKRSASPMDYLFMVSGFMLAVMSCALIANRYTVLFGLTFHACFSLWLIAKYKSSELSKADLAVSNLRS
jgi:Ca2+/Na+ antiporter